MHNAIGKELALSIHHFSALINQWKRDSKIETPRFTSDGMRPKFWSYLLIIRAFVFSFTTIIYFEIKFLFVSTAKVQEFVCFMRFRLLHKIYYFKIFIQKLFLYKLLLIFNIFNIIDMVSSKVTQHISSVTKTYHRMLFKPSEIIKMPM